MSDGNVTLETAGVLAGSALADVVEQRADIMTLTEATMEAVVAPKDPGGISSVERAALACRMAKLNGEQALAGYFAERMSDADAAAISLTDPAFVGNGDTRLDALIRHVDLVTMSPIDATEEDIDALKRAGVSEADVVRLAELVAFVNYQVRVIAGLRLLGEIA